MSKDIHISVVSPVYKAENIVRELVMQVIESVSLITEYFEIILVNDGSPDASWQRIIEECTKDKRVKGVNLSRNFGQHYAITAGLDHCNGEWIVVMDCDLQDQPKEILKLYNKTKENYDVVLGRRAVRKDSFIKRMFSKLFYKLLSYLTNTEQDSAIGNFGIYHRKVIEAIIEMKDSLKYIPAMVKWVGFNQTSIDVVHAKRESGKSAYSFFKLLNLSFDIMVSFSEKPLQLIAKLGILISVISGVFAFINIYKYFNGDIKVLGWSSIIISIWFFSGLIIFFLGIAGLYIAKIFERVKDRPVYIVKENINCND